MRWWQELDSADILVPTLAPRSTLSLDDDVHSLLSRGAVDWAHALSIELTRDYSEVSLTELARSAELAHLLQTSSESNLQRLLLDLDPDGVEVEPPREALLFVDEAVAQQVPLVAVLRGYQLAMEHWLRWCAPAIARHADPDEQADELQHAVTVAVRYIDRLSNIVVDEYEQELQRRATSGSARRAALVSDLLNGEVVDIDEASNILGYPLHGRHVALSLRMPASGTNQIEVLQAEARAFAAHVGGYGLLTLATGLTTMDAWVAVRQSYKEVSDTAAEFVHIGVGTPFSGVTGFIESHKEARRALELRDIARPGCLSSITYYHQIRLLALISQDLAGLRAFVTATLGNLASNDERSRELRETFLAFLDANKSYTAVARTSHLHKNTVIQRVTRAKELTALTAAEGIDIHVALMAIHMLGEDVLTSS